MLQAFLQVFSASSRVSVGSSNVFLGLMNCSIFRTSGSGLKEMLEREVCQESA